MQAVHIDGVRAPGQLGVWRELLPADKVLSVGVIDGRNIWKTDLRAALTQLVPLHDQLGERLWLGSSCSLSHVPVSLARRSGSPPT